MPERLTILISSFILIGIVSGACGPLFASNPSPPTAERVETTDTSPAPIPSSPAAAGAASENQVPSPTQSSEEGVDMDLQEANVLAVDFEALGEGQYRFHVTLRHDDDGEAPSFANWWQIDDLDGQEIGRRVLLHSHGNQPFTRSEVIQIPEGVNEVIVRGHDMLHGHGGQSILLDLITGDRQIFEE